MDEVWSLGPMIKRLTILEFLYLPVGEGAAQVKMSSSVAMSQLLVPNHSKGLKTIGNKYCALPILSFLIVCGSGMPIAITRMRFAFYSAPLRSEDFTDLL